MLKTEIVISQSCVERVDNVHSEIHFYQPRLKGYFKSRICVFFLNICGISAYIHEEAQNDL